MTATFTLREYQEECLDSTERALLGHQRGTGVGILTRGAVVLPVGSGKTVIFSELCRRWLDYMHSPVGTVRDRKLSPKVLVLVHRDFLAKQARDKIHSADPSLSVGIVMGNRNETGADVIIGSVQTLRSRRRLEQLPDIGLVIIDECHHANAASYVTIMESLGCYETDGVPCIGFTATLVRADALKPGDVWQEVVFTKDIIWGIRNGFLVDVRGKRVQVKGLDLSKVRRLAGDLQADAVAEELLDADAPDQLAQHYLDEAPDRVGAVFWPNVLAATAGLEAFQAAGLVSGLVLGETPDAEREAVYDGMRNGTVQVVHNVNVLTEGWDMPQVSCIVPARLTQSAGLYIQMIGRGTRPHRLPIALPSGSSSDKSDCLVLDPVGVTGRHKLATMADMTMSVVNPQEDESLLEAADRADLEEAALLGELELAAEIERQEIEHRERIAREVSLFADSAAVWLQTPRGTWFIPAGEWLLFLWPEGGGLFTLGTCQTNPHTPFSGSRVIAEHLLQDGAMEMAAKLARQADPKGHAERSASWRQRTTPASKRVQLARSLGVRVTARMTDADVADAVFVKLAEGSLGG